MIPEGQPYNNYTGDNSTVQFDFDFLIENASQLKVEHTDQNGTVAVLEADTDYTIHEIGNASGSYITFPIQGSSYSVLKSNEIISLQLTLPVCQESEYGKSSELDLKSLEYSFDYLTRLLQIYSRMLERAIKVREGSDIDTDELSTNINIVADNVSDINSVANNITDINTVEDNIADINTVAADMENINAVANNKLNIDAVADNEVNINAVNANKTNIDTCAANISAITSAPTYAANAHVWAEGSDIDVQTLGGVHSSKGWAEVWNDRARIISVKDFGAKGDGTTDDTSAIQTAINNCAASEGLLFFPAGTYICEGLNIPAIRLVGCGRKSVLKLKANAENNLVNITADNAIIEYLALDGDKTNQNGHILNETAQAAMEALIEEHPEIRMQLNMNSIYPVANNFAEAINCGVFINSHNNIKIENCIIKDFVNCAIAAKSCNGLSVLQNNISNCGDGANIAVSRGCGFLAFDTSNSIVSKNLVDGCTGVNVLFQHSSFDNVISYNRLLNSSFIGTGNGHNHRCKIIGNYITGCADNGIDMQQSHDVTVIGNTCYNNGTTGGGSKANLFWGTDYQTSDSNAIFADNTFIKTDDFISGGGGAENIQIYSPHNGFADGTKLQYMPKHVIFSNNYVYGGNYRTLDAKYCKTENNIFEKVVAVGASCIANKFEGNLFKNSDLQFTGGVRDLQIFGNTFVACGAQSDGRDADNEKYAIAFITTNDDTSVHMEINIENNTFELPDLTYKVMKENYVTPNRMSAIYVKNNKIIANGFGPGEEGIKLTDIVSYPLFSVNTEKVICFDNVMYASSYAIGNQRSTMQYPAVLSANKTDTSIEYLPPYGYTKVALMSERTVTGTAGHSYFTMFEIYRDPHVYDSNKPTVYKFTGIDTGSFTASVDNDTNVVTFTTTTVPNDGVYIVILEHQSLY